MIDIITCIIFICFGFFSLYFGYKERKSAKIKFIMSIVIFFDMPIMVFQYSQNVAFKGIATNSSQKLYQLFGAIFLVFMVSKLIDLFVMNKNAKNTPLINNNLSTQRSDTPALADGKLIVEALSSIKIESDNNKDIADKLKTEVSKFKEI